MIQKFLEFWAHLRAYFIVEPLGEAGPWVALFACALLAEQLLDRVIAPRFAERAPKLFELLTAGFDGLRAAVIGGLFAGATTLELENMLLGTLGGLGYSVLRWVGGKLGGPPGGSLTALLVCLSLAGCGAATPSTAEQAQVAACIADSKAQTQRAKHVCREERAACVAACGDSGCSTPCSKTACTQQDIDAIFAAANERELACLEQF